MGEGNRGWRRAPGRIAGGPQIPACWWSFCVRVSKQNVGGGNHRGAHVYYISGFSSVNSWLDSWCSDPQPFFATWTLTLHASNVFAWIDFKQDSQCGASVSTVWQHQPRRRPNCCYGFIPTFICNSPVVQAYCIIFPYSCTINVWEMHHYFTITISTVYILLTFSRSSIS